MIALAAKLKSRLLCIDFHSSTSAAVAEDLNTMLTATYILRAIAVLVRVRVEDLGQVDVEKSIVDLLGCVAQLLTRCRSTELEFYLANMTVYTETTVYSYTLNDLAFCSANVEELLNALFSNLKVFIEAATVLIGEHQQETPHFLSNWHLVRLTEQHLLAQFNENFISGYLTPPILQNMKALFGSNNSKEKYLQPLLLRFIGRIGRFLIVRLG